MFASREDVAYGAAPMEDRIKVAVIGTGALGKEHARLYADMHREGLIECVGVYDQNPETAHRVAQQHGLSGLASMEETLELSDALSIVTPTVTHFDIARRLLQASKHVLVEKPMTDDATQAAELVRLANQHGCVLQVGHVERFNPVFAYLQKAAREPKFIETHRLSPFPARSTDVGVV